MQESFNESVSFEEEEEELTSKPLIPIGTIDAEGRHYYGDITDIPAFAEQIRALLAQQLSDAKQCLLFNVRSIPDAVAFVRAGFLPELPTEEESNDYLPSYGEGVTTIAELNTLYLEDRLNGLTREEIKFWYTFAPTLPDLSDPDSDESLTLRQWPRWRYCTVAELIREAGETANSLPLLLFAPDRVYKRSKRPVTDMSIFRTPGASVINSTQIIPTDIYFKAELNGMEWQLVPVTRYAAGMSRGLYHGPSQSGGSFCGTFYYVELPPTYMSGEAPSSLTGNLESESSTYLAFRRALIARTKLVAMLQMEAMLGRHKTYIEGVTAPSEEEHIIHGFDESFLAYSLGYRDFAAGKKLSQLPRLPDDLMMTPLEVAAYTKEMDRHNKLHKISGPLQLYNRSFTEEEIARLPQRKRYMGQLLGFYASEDSFDRDLCLLGKELGYDIIVFTHMPGSHQIVTELVDVRDRTTSFDSLVYIAP
jgi:hypothetical protein